MPINATAGSFGYWCPRAKYFYHQNTMAKVFLIFEPITNKLVYWYD